MVKKLKPNLTGDQTTDLVHDQSCAVSQSAHITDGDGSPLAVVHLTLDRAHSSEAGSAQQVEDHKGVSGQSGVILRNCCPDLITVLRQLAAEVIQNTEGANTFSFAIRPETEATVARQLPKPRGAKIQAILVAIAARTELS